MSAPDTNLEKQKDRHKAPLFGIAAAVVFAFVLFVLFVAFVFFNGGDPDETLGAIEPEVASVQL